MIDPAFGHWLAGFADGEGCFWIHREKGGDYYAPQFKIKLRADDREILLECQRRLGIGNIYEHPPSFASPNTCPQTSWAVQSKADGLVLLSVFDTYPLRAKKARDYVIWREAVLLWQVMPRGNRWHGPRDWAPMLEIKARLEAVRRYPETTCASS